LRREQWGTQGRAASGGGDPVPVVTVKKKNETDRLVEKKSGELLVKTYSRELIEGKRILAINKKYVDL